MHTNHLRKSIGGTYKNEIKAKARNDRYGLFRAFTLYIKYVMWLQFLHNKTFNILESIEEITHSHTFFS